MFPSIKLIACFALLAINSVSSYGPIQNWTLCTSYVFGLQIERFIHSLTDAPEGQQPQIDSNTIEVYIMALKGDWSYHYWHNLHIHGGNVQDYSYHPGDYVAISTRLHYLELAKEAPLNHGLLLRQYLVEKMSNNFTIGHMIDYDQVTELYGNFKQQIEVSGIPFDYLKTLYTATMMEATTQIVTEPQSESDEADLTLSLDQISQYTDCYTLAIQPGKQLALVKLGILQSLFDIYKAFTFEPLWGNDGYEVRALNEASWTLSPYSASLGNMFDNTHTEEERNLPYMRFSHVYDITVSNMSGSMNELRVDPVKSLDDADEDQFLMSVVFINIDETAE